MHTQQIVTDVASDRKDMYRNWELWETKWEALLDMWKAYLKFYLCYLYNKAAAALIPPFQLNIL